MFGSLRGSHSNFFEETSEDVKSRLRLKLDGTEWTGQFDREASLYSLKSRGIVINHRPCPCSCTKIKMQAVPASSCYGFSSDF